MKKISLVNSNRKIEVDDEHFEVVNAYRWYLDRETGFAFRIVGWDGSMEFLQNFLARRVAHWADDE
jgi:hypothetical protein